MTRNYEIVYIFDSSSEEAAITDRLNQHHALLKSDGQSDPVENIDHWGTRTLAYPIKGRETGYYVVGRFKVDPTVLPEFERALKLDESVLRYLLVLNEGELPRPPRPRDESDEGRSARPAAPGAKPEGTGDTAEKTGAKSGSTNATPASQGAAE